MLLLCALCITLVGLMHSVLGGRRLIGPLTRLENFPVILGSAARSRKTLLVGWHLLSVTWWAMAALLVYMHFFPAARSEAFLWMISGLFGTCGVLALILSRGRHVSWLLFLPAALSAALAAVG